jgi:hypothetical protein
MERDERQVFTRRSVGRIRLRHRLSGRERDCGGSSLRTLSRTYYPTIAVSPDRLVLPMNSQQSAVWMLDNVER